MTIKEIANLCGVSRGTVDRVLNNRGHVNPETAERVRAVLEENGYTPNYAARILAVRKKAPTIGIVVFTQKNPFIFDVITGIQKAIGELQYNGISIALKTMQRYDVEEQLALIDELEPSISALILLPIDAPAIRERIADLYQKGIPTFTVASDIENSKRLCYIGSNYRQGGQLAAGIMRLIAPPQASICVLSGSSELSSHNQRLTGFVEQLSKTRPDIRIEEIVYTQDDDRRAYEGTIQMLRNHPQISMIQILAGGVQGIFQALQSVESPPSVVAFDLTKPTSEMLKQGIAKALIFQNPVEQGFRVVQMVCEYIINGTISSPSCSFIRNEVLLPENVDQII